MSLLFSGNCQELQALFKQALEQSPYLSVTDEGIHFDFEDFIEGDEDYEGIGNLREFLKEDIHPLWWKDIHKNDRNSVIFKDNQKFFLFSNSDLYYFMKDLREMLSLFKYCRKKSKSTKDDEKEEEEGFFSEDEIDQGFYHSHLLEDAPKSVMAMEKICKGYDEMFCKYNYCVECHSLSYPFGSFLFYPQQFSLVDSFVEKRKKFVEYFLHLDENSRKTEKWIKNEYWKDLMCEMFKIKNYSLSKRRDLLNIKSLIWRKFLESKSYSWFLSFLQNEDIGRNLREDFYRIFEYYFEKDFFKSFDDFVKTGQYDIAALNQDLINVSSSIDKFFQDFVFQNPLLALFELEILTVYENKGDYYIGLSPSYVHFELSFDSLNKR